jgi:polysaccharide chain length determinant protein (PEP-CTERM system associated)
MQEKPQPLQISYYLDVLSRRRWFIIIPFCLVMIIGIAVAIKLPKLYSATTLILIQPQTVPTDYVRPLIASGIESRIASISQEIKSRSNLENIINRFNLFRGSEHANMYMEDKIQNLRNQITVEVFSDRRRSAPAEAFSISFKGQDPDAVTNITNYLAESFINENMRMREQEGLGTSGFIEDQLNSVKSELEKLEQQLKIFREKNMGGLPEQLDTNLRILDRLQMEYTQKQETLREAKRRLVLLNDQIIQAENLQQNPAYSSGGSQVSENDPYVRLQNMKQELENLKSRYTGVHPDVVKLELMVKSLERQIKEGIASSSENDEGMNPLYLDRLNSLTQQRNETIFEIGRLENDVRKLNSQTAYYQKLVDETPKKEQELITLNRDYQNMRNNYSSLLEKKTQADLAVNLEMSKKGEQFRILDRAQVPNRPSDPDMKKLFLITVFAALGLGGGFVILFEHLDSSVNNVKDIEYELGLPVLTFIPKIYTMKDRIYHRLNLATTTLSIMLAMALCAGLGLMALKGVEPAIDMVKRLAG